MRNDLMRKILVLLIFGLVLTGIIAGETIQNNNSSANLTDNYSNQSNSVLVPLENITNFTGIIANVSGNLSLTEKKYYTVNS